MVLMAVNVEAIEDQRKRLIKLRDRLSKAIDGCSENMLPQLSGQYRATLAELSALPPTKAAVVTVRDQLKERREQKRTPAARRSAAPKKAPAARSTGRQRGA